LPERHLVVRKKGKTGKQEGSSTHEDVQYRELS